MEKLLMLGDRVASRHIVEYAQSQGIHTIVTDFLPPEKSVTKQISDEYWMLSTADIDALEEKCRQEGVTMVMTGVNEFNITNQMDLCSRLGLPCYCTPEAFHYNQNKADFKEACRKYGVPTAKQYTFSDDPTDEELNAVEYPVFTKAIDLYSNIGMSYCYNPEQLRQGIALAKEKSRSGNYIVEKMLTGREYTGFYVLADGEVSLLNFYSMFTPAGRPTNCYSISISTADCLERYLAEFDPYVKEMLKGIGCRNGVAWIELMTDEDGHFYALEMGHRLSGDIMWMPLREVTGFDTLAWMFNYARTGKNDPNMLPISQTKRPGKYGCSYILWTSRAGTVTKIQGLDELRKEPDFYVQNLSLVGNQMIPFQYAAVVAFSADSCEKLCQMIEHVSQTVRILDENGEDILIRFEEFDQIRALDQASCATV